MGKLFVSVALTLVLGCGSSAQGIITADDAAPQDSAKSTDPIVIDEDRQVANWDVNGESVIINASKSTIALKGTCRELKVNGSDNNIRSCKVESVTVTGNSNLVTYPSKSQPEVVDKGKDNSVLQRP